MERPDVVLFDLDGTLVDSRDAYARSMNHALVAAGLPRRPDAELYLQLGPPIHETLEQMRVPPQLVEPIVTGYRTRFAEHGLAETQVYAGIGELLSYLHGRVRLGVATSKPVTAAVGLLSGLGLAELFETICGPDPETVKESKAVTIGRALAALSASTPVISAVMVGDRLYDVLGAHAHGLPAIGVLWGVGSETELREAGAAEVVRAPGEIPPLLGL